MKNKKYLVIIGDIIKSRELKNRKKFQAVFHEYLNANKIDTNLTLSEMMVFNNNIISRFTVTIGDEFQGVIKSADHLFKFILDFEYSLKNEMKENINFRYGMGIGKITTKINEDAAIGMDGPAFYHARESLEKAKREKLKYCLKSSMPKDEVINTMLQWLGHENRRWGFQKFQIINLKKNGWTQKQIAENLSVSQPAVSKALKTAPVQLTIQTEKIIEKHINSILNEEQETTYSMVAEPSNKYNSKSR